MGAMEIGVVLLFLGAAAWCIYTAVSFFLNNFIPFLADIYYDLPKTIFREKPREYPDPIPIGKSPPMQPAEPAPMDWNTASKSTSFQSTASAQQGEPVREDSRT